MGVGGGKRYRCVGSVVASLQSSLNGEVCVVALESLSELNLNPHYLKALVTIVTWVEHDATPHPCHLLLSGACIFRWWRK